MSTATTLNLDQFETKALMELESRAAATYYAKMAVRGNALRSSVFVKSITPGATLKVNYYDTTTGTDDLGERFDLTSHALIDDTAAGKTFRITVNQIHNKPQAEIIVTGGVVEFGIYISVVPDQFLNISPEDLDNLTQQVLKATDKQVVYTWLDFGDKRNERISKITYSSVSVGHTVSRDFSYTLIGNDYRLDLELWSIT